MVCQETGLPAGDGWEPLPGTGLSFPWLVACDPQPARANNYRGPKIFTSAQTEGIRVTLSKGCLLARGKKGCVRLQRTGWGARPGIWGAGGASRQRAAGGRGRVKVPRPPTSAVASHLVPSNLHQSSGPPALGTCLLHSFMAGTEANSDLVRERGITSQQSCDTCPNLSPK